MAPALLFPFAERPADGATLEVAPGVHWVRMPIPIPGLDYINLWLLRDGDGWTIVDTGLRGGKIEALWTGIFERMLAGRPVKRIICTHFHPDHLGQAGWLTRRFGAPLWMTLTEWTFGRMLALDARPEPPEDAVAFYRRAGFDETAIARFKARGFNNFAKGVTEIPSAFRRISDGDSIGIDGVEWRVMVGRGHSPEHACLYAPALKVLISGDQVLPRITPHIGVYPGEPEANPLKQYLSSLDRFRGLPADTLVLPAHQDPFVGLETRLDELQAHHEARLTALAEGLGEPLTVLQALPLIFKREHGGDTAFLAVGEALAHLHYLLGEGAVERTLGPDGVYRYRSLAARTAAAE
jgi:glyoxylase-like metal-dependent hydrolase (beta-lactamase superfamily II)